MAASGGATLRYDPLGRLYEAAGPSGTRRFVWDGDALVAEYDAAGTLLERYVHGGAAGADDPLVWYRGSNRRRLHADHQGSIVAVTGSTGGLIAANAYDAWGIPNAANLGRFGYTGQIWLSELGMWHYKARMYSPTLGRFLQVDPIGYEDQLNLYAYVGNDPVNQVDPDGTCYAGAAAIAGGTSLADGPLPIGEAIGAAILAGSCIHRAYRAISAAISLNESSEGRDHGASQDAEGRIVTDQTGKVHGDLPNPDDVPDEALRDSVRALNNSIRTREQAIRNNPRGDPEGTPRERREFRQRINHEERVRREEEVRDRLIDRLLGR